MSGEWNAPDTLSGMTRFAPASVARAIPCSTPASSPLTTTWPAVLKLAGTHTPRSTRAHTSSTAASSSPRIAAIVPGRSFPAFDMSSPRRRTASRASRKESAPAATYALNSPREWPAAKATGPSRSRTTRSTATECARMAGCALRVSVSVVFRSVRHQGGEAEAEHVVGLGERLGGGRIGIGERPAHAHDLRSLSGKEECQRHDVLPRPRIRSARLARPT